MNEHLLDFLKAIVKFQIKRRIGDEAWQALADTFTDASHKQLGAWMEDSQTRAQLDKAILATQACFKATYGDSDMAQAALSMALAGHPDLEAAILDLDSVNGEERLVAVMSGVLYEQMPHLSQRERAKVIRDYVRCLREAVAGMDAYMGQTIIRELREMQAQADRIEGHVERTAVIVQDTYAGVGRIEETVAGSDEMLKILMQRTQPQGPPSTAALDYQPPTLTNYATLQARGELPIGSRVNFRPNAHFVGRHDDLLALAKAMLEQPTGGAVGILQAASVMGMGGLGKTQLAVEFVYRYGRFFKGVHWLQVPPNLDPDGVHRAIESDIAQAGLAMNLPHWPDTQPEQVALTLQIWQQYPTRLVVFDNLEDAAVLQTWLARLPEAKVLVTSRRTDWPASLVPHPLRLDVLRAAESRDLLRQLAPRLQNTPDTDLDALAERLGHLPLAIDLAGRYLKDSPHLTPAAYLQRLTDMGNTLDNAAFKEWVKRSDNPTQHDTSLYATFELTWQQLGRKKHEDMARKIFRAAGYLAPNEPIPSYVLAHTVDGVEDGTYSDLFTHASTRLLELGLLVREVEGVDALTIHPLLADYARLKDSKTKASVLPKLANVMGGVTNRANQTGLPAAFAPLRPHVLALLPHAEAEGVEDVGALWNNYGAHLNMLADHSGAKAAFERALAIDERVYGPDHPNVAIRVSNLGKVIKALGNLAQAEKMQERALSIFEQAFGHVHPHVGTALNDLADVLREKGDMAGAKDRFEQALAIYEQVYGTEHPFVATAVNNLGGVLHAMGDHRGAKAAFERALAIDERVYGTDHPNAATDVNNLGEVLRVLGDHHGAKAAYERALAIFERVLGENHPNVATLVNNLGSVLQAMGDHRGAKAAYERALAIWEQVLGENHPNVAICLWNMGDLEYNMGNRDEGIRLLERVLSIFERFYPPNHPYIQQVQRTLAYWRGQLGGGGAPSTPDAEAEQAAQVRAMLQRMLAEQGVEAVRQALRGAGLPDEAISAILQDIGADLPATPPPPAPPPASTSRFSAGTLTMARKWLAEHGEAGTRARLQRAGMSDADIEALLAAVMGMGD